MTDGDTAFGFLLGAILLLFVLYIGLDAQRDIGLLEVRIIELEGELHLVEDRVTDLENQWRGLQDIFVDCAEDNGWNPVVGCFDLD